MQNNFCPCGLLGDHCESDKTNEGKLGHTNVYYFCEQ